MRNLGQTASAPAIGARLEAVSGPLKGKLFPLLNDEISIGRDPSNHISLLDSLVSRRHCVIRPEGDGFRLLDLESRNNTFISGVPVRDRILVHGDQIRVGNTILVFQGADTESITGNVPLSLDANPAPGAATVVLRKEDVVYLQPPRPDALPANVQTVRDLNVLLDFSRTLNSVRDLAELQEKVLQAVLAIAPADRAAILLSEKGIEGVSSIVGRDRKLGPNQPVHASQTILARVLDEGVAVLSNEVQSDESYREADSLLERRVRAVLAVPLEVQGKILGAMYLETTAAGARFDSELLQLVTTLGNIAALAIENARHLERLGGENKRLHEELNIHHSMVGESKPMHEVYGFVSRVAGRDSTVLISGESGTGKELVARAVHMNSARADKPFVAINCAAITETLLESELFGHERGAFTGAVAQKKGKLEVAEGGSVFLDEIGELALPMQAKLLRVLQEREFERVGGTRSIKLDVRLIAATNRDLAQMMEERQFRSDLYYRLRVFPVTVPPLRERRGDIQILVRYFTQKHAQRMSKRIEVIPPETIKALSRWNWPGNVRELENFIERGVILSQGPVLRLPIGELHLPENEPATSGTLEAQEREHIIRVLRETNGVIAGPKGAATRLGLKRTTLNSMMQKLGISRKNL